jgi:hypothetical protein
VRSARFEQQQGRWQTPTRSRAPAFKQPSSRTLRLCTRTVGMARCSFKSTDSGDRNLTQKWYYRSLLSYFTECQSPLTSKEYSPHDHTYSKFRPILVSVDPAPRRKTRVSSGRLIYRWGQLAYEPTNHLQPGRPSLSHQRLFPSPSSPSSAALWRGDKIYRSHSIARTILSSCSGGSTSPHMSIEAST